MFWTARNEPSNVICTYLVTAVGPWGESLGNKPEFSKASSSVEYGFAGRQFDSESQLYYYRARMYSPELGRFTSPDPIALSGGDINFYRYVSNSPIKYLDQQGTGPILYGACILAVTGGLALGIYAIEKYVANQIANQEAIIADAQKAINQDPKCNVAYEKSLISQAEAQITTLNALNLAALALLPRLVASGATGCDAALAAGPF